MKNLVKILSYFFVFSVLISCKSSVQEKTTDNYLTKILQLTNSLDSMVDKGDDINCIEFRDKVNSITENLFKDDSLLHNVGIELQGNDIFDLCGGGFAKHWIFPQGNFQCKCKKTQSWRFDTKNFGQCFFEIEEGTIPVIVKNGIEYDYMLNLNLNTNKKYKNKFSPVVSLEVFIPRDL